ncbi:transcriptional regulator [Candidatus Thermokryptus mobilis]|uniref:Transcriptional regulator n=1 Tax=Candidatus Thermokryptus mobilis TaxID=1643428 RepID=A0A0S4MSN1_9BACT|nr:transcriptional regulator [Candidatus Thermokryptus mobilis]CUU00769.1 transcriptional regulator [Candidatus Thermokryptus mobilis]
MKGELDEIIHQPTRTKIMASLYTLGEGGEIEFIALRDLLGLSDGNLSSHLSKLEEAGYVKIRKTFEGKKPKTYISLTAKGRKAFENYISVLKKMFEGEKF